MNRTIQKLMFSMRAMRIDKLRREIRLLEDKQRASLGVRLVEHHAMATRIRPPVPEFLRRGRA